ncbi:MAG TPA: hypothetical protein DDZ39_04905 [Flavobacteriaceae bacterium]|jgi:hypothetical protein|nr:hypothetical protein [Flavobacteriaceae bacterium]
MIEIEKQETLTSNEIDDFTKSIDFILPKDFIIFYKMSNGGIINSEEKYINLWKLTEMKQLNIGYCTDEFFPNFFIFASNGGGTAYFIKKNTSLIYEAEFIDSVNDLKLICKTFTEFIEEFPLKPIG